MTVRPPAAALALAVLVAACGGGSSSTPGGKATPTPAATATPTPGPSGAVSPTPTPFPVVTVTPTPVYSGSPTPSPTPSPTATTATLGAPGSTLTFPAAGPISAQLTVPAGMGQPGALVALSTQSGRPIDSIIFTGGRTLETFGLTLYAVSGFHEPAFTAVIPAGLKAPALGYYLATTYAGDSAPTDFTQIPVPSGTTLVFPSDSTCLQAIAGRTLYFSVVAQSSPPPFPAPTAGPTTCPS